MDRSKMNKALEKCRNALEKIYREGYEAGHRDCLSEMSESGRACQQCVFCETHKDQSGHCYMWGSHLYRVDDDGCAMFLRKMFPLKK